MPLIHGTFSTFRRLSLVYAICICHINLYFEFSLGISTCMYNVYHNNNNRYGSVCQDPEGSALNTDIRDEINNNENNTKYVCAVNK